MSADTFAERDLIGRVSYMFRVKLISDQSHFGKALGNSAFRNVVNFPADWRWF